MYCKWRSSYSKYIVLIQISCCSNKKCTFLHVLFWNLKKNFVLFNLELLNFLHPLLKLINQFNNRFSGKMDDGPLEFEDILPDDPREYDKMAPPREVGQPTIVYFHVTVMSLDSIDEESMVSTLL